MNSDVTELPGADVEACELRPLSGEKAAVHRRPSRPPKQRRLKGPLRVVRLLLLSILLPGLLVAVPLYLRFHVYHDQLYPAAVSDMRLIDARVSTTWCQRQLVEVNTTFNAFLLEKAPSFQATPVHVSMTRHLVLEDDMKEYWGFYLLKGSSITVSTCVRWPGSSLMVIRGIKHLHDCAYIGDDSSEELEELIKAAQEVNPTIPQLENDADDNNPDLMRRFRPGVVLHASRKPIEAHEQLDHHPPHNEHEDLTKFAESVAKGKAPPKESTKPNVDPSRNEKPREYGLPAYENALPKKGTVLVKHPHGRTHSSRDGEDNQQNDTTKKSPVPVDFQRTGSMSPNIKRNSTEEEENDSIEDSLPFNGDTTENQGIEISGKSAASDLQTTAESSALQSNASSSEVFEDILKRLQHMGKRGKNVLKRLQKQLGDSESSDDELKEDTVNILRKLVREYMEGLPEQEKERKSTPVVTERPPSASNVNTTDGNDTRREEHAEDGTSLRRNKRQIILSHLGNSLNETEEDENGAFEEMEPDEHADHHVRVNKTDPRDMSNSEYWSSFSSSEEALLKCDGLIVNLPLTPSMHCADDAPAHQVHQASIINTLTYKVPVNGYYFFVFNSENEKQTNYLRAHFSLEKTVYNVSKPLASCLNSTGVCSLPLDFFSSETAVLEVPVPDTPDDIIWSQSFVVHSTCEPRTAIYLVCVIAVPLVILLFAFQ